MDKITTDEMVTEITDNLAAIREHFPEAITDGKIDFAILRQLLGETVEGSDEKYGLQWRGKRQARHHALTPSTGTLLPDVQASLDWATTNNIAIEGDNLEVLKLLAKAYAGRIKLIYIDPPYNTGKDFVYPDSFQDSIRNYLELTGQRDDQGRQMSSNVESSGRFHTDWLNMIYPRLKLARNLLKLDGILCVSIDDNEEAAMRFLLDEVFGEENRISTLVWHLGQGPTAGHFLRSHETILCYARDKTRVPNFVWRGGGDVIASALKRISAANPASDITFPAGIEIEGGGDRDFASELGGTTTQTAVAGSLKFKEGKLVAPVTLRAGWAMKTQIESWLRGDETFDTQGQKVARFYFSRAGLLMYQKERSIIRPRTVLIDIASTADGSRDIENCGLSRRIFDFPKPVALIQSLITWITDPGAEDIILDFFAGSGTTGHSVLATNSEDGGNRSFICVQLPEPLPRAEQIEGHEHLRTIFDAMIMRIRGAAAILRPSGNLKDEGFKVFRLASSNARPWDPNAADVNASLFAHVDHIETGRSELDILYELMLRLGVSLTTPIDEKVIGSATAYSVGNGTILAYLASSITSDMVEEIASEFVTWWQDLATAGATTVVFRDSAFASDVVKINLDAILKQRGISSVKCI